MVDRVSVLSLRLSAQRVAFLWFKPVQPLLALLVRIDAASACGVLTYVLHLGGVA